MSKFSVYALWIGVFFGTVVGGVITRIGWIEDPMVFEEDPWYSIPIFLSWFIPAQIPFVVVTTLVEGVRLVRSKWRK